MQYDLFLNIKLETITPISKAKQISLDNNAFNVKRWRLYLSYSKVGSSNFGPRKKSALHHQQILYLSFKWQICILITNKSFFITTKT